MNAFVGLKDNVKVKGAINVICSKLNYQRIIYTLFIYLFELHFCLQLNLKKGVGELTAR